MSRALVFASLLAAVTACSVAGCGREGEASYSPDAICEGGEPPARQLRLLTRREYNRSVSELFRLDEARTCELDSDCQVDSESCVGGVCEADPCGLHTFLFAANGRAYDSVVVAGTFNGWSPDVEGWPMSYLPERDLWVTKRSLSDGEHLYKFVIDGAEWVPDPNNSRLTDDGYGGYNSMLTMDCADARDAVFDAAAAFPVESRPQHYAYDNHAEAGLVTSVHVEQYLRAGRSLAELALQDPEALLGCSLSDDACVDDFLERFQSRAWRRPITSSERARARALVDAQPTREEGLSVAIQVALSSPYFLYRFELGEPLEGEDLYLLTDFEMAHALSYFFWGGPPDDALWEAAEAGELSTPEQVEAEARRLLEDPRARDLSGVFFTQWLGLEGLATQDKSPALYPQWSDALAQDMVEEVQRFVSYEVFDGDRGFDALLTSEESFVNGRLAEVYGLSEVSGGAWQRVALPEGRSGLLSHPAVLTATAHSDQTSPVRRGLFVRETLLCQELGAPPADAGGVPDVDPEASTRERFAQHASDPSCANCHQYIDPVGFGFEAYDALGAWRATDNGHPIDASGEVLGVEGLNPGDGQRFETLPELADILVASESAHVCFTTQAWRFAHGVEEGSDCIIEGLHDQFAQSGYSVQELMVAIISDPAFRLRRGE